MAKTAFPEVDINQDITKLDSARGPDELPASLVDQLLKLSPEQLQELIDRVRLAAPQLE